MPNENDRLTLSFEASLGEWAKVMHWLHDNVGDLEDDPIGNLIFRFVHDALDAAREDQDEDACLICRWQTQGLNDSKICPACMDGLGIHL